MGVGYQLNGYTYRMSCVRCHDLFEYPVGLNIHWMRVHGKHVDAISALMPLVNIDPARLVVVPEKMAREVARLWRRE